MCFYSYYFEQTVCEVGDDIMFDVIKEMFSYFLVGVMVCVDDIVGGCVS